MIMDMDIDMYIIANIILMIITIVILIMIIIIIIIFIIIIIIMIIIIVIIMIVIITLFIVIWFKVIKLYSLKMTPTRTSNEQKPSLAWKVCFWVQLNAEQFARLFQGISGVFMVSFLFILLVPTPIRAPRQLLLLFHRPMIGQSRTRPMSCCSLRWRLSTTSLISLSLPH